MYFETISLAKLNCCNFLLLYRTGIQVNNFLGRKQCYDNFSMFYFPKALITVTEKSIHKDCVQQFAFGKCNWIYSILVSNKR